MFLLLLLLHPVGISDILYTSIIGPEVAGGTNILHQTMQSFLPASVATCIVIDLHGYDGWPALSALEDSWLISKSDQEV